MRLLLGDLFSHLLCFAIRRIQRHSEQKEEENIIVAYPLVGGRGKPERFSVFRRYIFRPELFAESQNTNKQTADRFTQQHAIRSKSEP